MADDWLLFSDGGGEVASSAASACIVRDRKSGAEYRFVLFLGGATNNEAEIFAGLAGFSAIRVFAGHSHKIRVRWVADSEYTLKSASTYIANWARNGWKTASRQPVKNQGLWRLYLELRQNFEIEYEHVAGHSGHPENELCDSAATWCRKEGGALAGRSSLAVVEATSGAEWLFSDARALIAQLREANSSVPELRETLAKLVRVENAPLCSDPTVHRNRVENLQRVVRKLDQFCEDVSRRFQDEDAILALVRDLRQLCDRYRSN